MNNNEIKELLFNLETNTVFKSEINKASFLLFLTGNKLITLEYINIIYFHNVKFFFDKYKDFFYYKISKFDKNEFIIYFSFNIEKLAIFKRNFDLYIEGNNSYIKKIGLDLGFPYCCVSIFSSFFKDKDIKDIKYYMFDFMNAIVSKTTNFDKNLDIFENDRRVFHTPCDFSCIKSKDIALSTQNFFKNKEYGNNAYIYLYFKTNDYIKFNKNGKYLGEGVYYEYNEKESRELFNYYISLIKNNGDHLELDKFCVNKGVIYLNFE